MFAEGPVARRGLQGATRPIEDGSSVGACHGNYEHQLHCERQGDRGNLHGYCDHFLVRWVTLSGLRQEALVQGPIIEDIMDLV